MSGPVPITYIEIEAYCRLTGIDSASDRARLLSLLEPLDRQWMSDAHDAAEKERNKKKP